MEQASTVIVIPAYNEGATIRDLVMRCLKHSLPVIVVDDGSSDNTAAELEDLPITLLRNAQNSGKAATLWHGMQHAIGQGAEQVITLDGDGQHSPEDIPAVLHTAAQHPGSIIIAARLKDNDKAPRARLAANRFADFWISWASGQWIHDTQSGYRLYPASLLSQLSPNTDRKNSFVFESKVLIDAAAKGFCCHVTPISSSYHANARPSHLQPVTDITRIVLMVAWSLFSRGFYPSGLWHALSSKRKSQ
jgi:glycosyltransferase involved in cell wall biosynthesis